MGGEDEQEAVRGLRRRYFPRKLWVFPGKVEREKGGSRERWFLGTEQQRRAVVVENGRGLRMEVEAVSMASQSQQSLCGKESRMCHSHTRPRFRAQSTSGNRDFYLIKIFLKTRDTSFDR